MFDVNVKLKLSPITYIHSLSYIRLHTHTWNTTTWVDDSVSCLLLYSVLLHTVLLRYYSRSVYSAEHKSPRPTRRVLPQDVQKIQGWVMKRAINLVPASTHQFVRQVVRPIKMLWFQSLVHFAFCTKPTRRLLRVIFWPIKMFGWKIRVVAKKMYVAYEPRPLVVIMMRNPVQFDAFWRI